MITKLVKFVVVSNIIISISIYINIVITGVHPESC